MANPEHLQILREGIGVWNEWRRKRTITRPDLSHSDLSHADLRNVNRNSSSLIKPVQFPITVRGVSLVLDNTAVAASDTDYWTVDVGRIPALSSSFGSIMATKTTQTTGGAAFLTNQAWNFDAVTFTAVNQTLVKDDILAIRFTKTGAPTNLQGMVASVRWQVA